MTEVSDAVLFAVDDRGVATIALNKPEVRNALDDEMFGALHHSLDLTAEDDSVRCAVLTSTHEKIFSAGGNLNAFAAEESLMTKHQRNATFPALVQKIGALPVPVICALNGHALAGSFGLALACDLIIAREGVDVGTPEINIGAFPFMISALMMRNIQPKVVAEMLFLGDRMSVSEAHAHGIVNRVESADRFSAAVDQWAGQIAAKSPLMLKLGKEALYKQRDLSLQASMALMQHYLTLAQNTEDNKEGVAAFMEKREPVWKGR